MKNAPSVQSPRWPADVIAQVVIAVFDAARGVSTPYLLRDRFRKQTQLPLAFLDLQVGLLQLQSAFLHLGFKLIPRVTNRDFRYAFARN